MMDYEQLNNEVAGFSAEEVVAWGVERAGPGKAVVSTNFRPYEAVILHMVTRVAPGIPVLWVDLGYNTPQTYRFAEKCIEQLDLNVKLYIPRRTRAHRDTVNGGVPGIEDKEAHDAFTEEVKLEPFRRGLEELAPEVLFTALRRETQLRQSLRTLEPHGDVIKVSPLLDWSDAEMDAYLGRHDLPNETVYHDPTKVLDNRECGLHLVGGAEGST